MDLSVQRTHLHLHGEGAGSICGTGLICSHLGTSITNLWKFDTFPMKLDLLQKHFLFVKMFHTCNRRYEMVDNIIIRIS